MQTRVLIPTRLRLSAGSRSGQTYESHLASRRDANATWNAFSRRRQFRVSTVTVNSVIFGVILAAEPFTSHQNLTVSAEMIVYAIGIVRDVYRQ